MNQIEREYKNALDEVRFSQEAKERMMKNLMKQEERAPVRRGGFRPLRAGLIAAAACAALLGTAGAANVMARQANINFLDSYGEAEDAQKARQGDDSLGVYRLLEDLKDYDECTPLDMEVLWNGEPGATLVEETVGIDGEGWTAKRVIQYERDGKTYQSTMYKAEAPSGYNSLWKSWDTSWLEEHYTSTARQTFFKQVETGGKIDQISVLGEFRGQGDTVFNVQYSWIGGVTFDDQNYLREEYDHIETYTTADGVKVTIMTAPSNSGKTLFWAEMLSGGGFFSMFGTQVELDELHSILDSLNLSRMLEYAPAH